MAEAQLPTLPWNAARNGERWVFYIHSLSLQICAESRRGGPPAQLLLTQLTAAGKSLNS